MPSTVSPRFGVRRNARCKRRTVVPVAPSAIVDWPGFDMLSPFYFPTLRGCYEWPESIRQQVAPDHTHCSKLLVYAATGDCCNRHARPRPSELTGMSQHSNQISLFQLYRHFERLAPPEWNSE